jgi:hypothetical protein
MSVAQWIRGLPAGVVQAIKGAFDYPNSVSLTALGTTLAGALLLPRDFNVVTGVSANTGVRLQAGVDVVVSTSVDPNGTTRNQYGVIEIGDSIIVVNKQATQALLVYPNTATGTVQGAGAGAGFSVAANKQATFYYCGLDVWSANLSA